MDKLFVKKSRLMLLFIPLSLFLSGCPWGKKTSAELVGLREGKKVFTYYRTSDPKSLDPMRQFDAASGNIIQQVYDTLLEYEYLVRPYTLKPYMLEKMPVATNAELTEYTLTLRKGIYFTDDACFKDGKGREVNSDDMIYMLKRFADANVNAQSYFLLKGMVLGMDEYRAQTEKLSGQTINYDSLDITGVKKIDRYSISLTLTSPNLLFLYAFAASPLSVVPREAVEKYGDDFAWKPVGTGPFILQSFGKGQTIILRKNPNFFDTYPTVADKEFESQGLLKNAGQKLPLLDLIYIHSIPEAQPRMLKFRRGEIDWVAVDRDNFTKMATKNSDGTFTLKERYSKSYSLYAEPALSMSYLAINLKDPFLGKHTLVRKAIAKAIDRDLTIDLLFNGRAEKLGTIVPLTIAGNEHDISHTPLTYDPEGAKKLLIKAGFPDGKGLPEFTIEYRGTTADSRRNFELLRANLSDVGIKVKSNLQTFAAYLKTMDSSKYEIAEGAWRADYPDAENFYQLLYGPNAAPGPNNSNFDNAEYNSLYEKIRYMQNSPERYASFKRMAEIIDEEVPIILLYNPIAVGLQQKWVKNFNRNMMMDVPFKYMDIDVKQKLEALDDRVHN